MKYKINTKAIPMLVILFIAIVFIAFLKMQDSSDWFSDDLFAEISYEVPSKFESSDYTYSRHYSYYDNDVYCNLNIESDDSSIYDDFKDWFMNSVHFNLSDKISELKEITINGHEMYYVDKKSKNSTVYYYGVKSSNYYYSITYTLNDYENGDRADIDTNLCYTAKDKIISTIQVK